jgi:hypothetical protein
MHNGFLDLGMFCLLQERILRKEITELFEKTKELFTESGIKYSVIGIALGFISVLIIWFRSYFSEQFESSIQIIVYGVLGASLLAVSLVKDKKN